jgi:glyoxalase family protein
MKTAGLHHITSVTRDPQTNIDFYQQVLGQRLVITTINFDDPGTYHLYYGDYTGVPGTAMTFFGWLNSVQGKVGTGETQAVAYTIPQNSLSFWNARLKQFGFSPMRIETRFGQEVIPFIDPEGMRLELITAENLPEIQPWPDSPIPEENELHGFYGVSLWLDEIETTTKILTDVLGYESGGQKGDRYRFRVPGNAPGKVVDLVHKPNTAAGIFGASSVHHIAFRASSDEQQQQIQQKVRQMGIHATQVIDRHYFRSVYFRTPGGVLFEIATDQPGFTVDESAENIGKKLFLPPWLEPRREAIEANLPAIRRSLPQEVTS